MKLSSLFHSPAFMIPGLLLLLCISGCREESVPDEIPVEETTSSAVNDSTGTINPSTEIRPSTEANPEPENRESPSSKIYRFSNAQKRAEEQELQKSGIQKYESNHLILYSDLEEDLVKELPGYADLLYEKLVEYFGELPPSREGTDFRVTGYLMGKRELFLETKLIPEDLQVFAHGRHLGTEFWMNDQKEDYYRRHLLFHEFTHCFMLSVPETEAPASYLEGMAELFATHQIETGEGTTQCRFGEFPDLPENYKGFGRIEMILDDLGKERFLSLKEIQELSMDQFSVPSHYAWSWASCFYFFNHPRYSESFRRYGQSLIHPEKNSELNRTFSPDMKLFSELEWSLMIRELCYGYQFGPAYVDFDEGEVLKENEIREGIQVQANRSWQSGGVQVRKGETYELQAEGEFLLSKDPKPWVSQPQGVSIDYFHRKPLGMLWAVIIKKPNEFTPVQSEFPMIPIGNQHQFRANMDGTLYFRVNDYPDSLSENEGTIAVRIRKIEIPD